MRASRIVGLLAAFSVPGWTAGLEGQGSPPPSVSIPIDAQHHPEAPLLTVTLEVPVGSDADPSGQEGALSLLGAALAHTAESTASDIAVVRIGSSVGRTETRFTIVVEPERWPDVYPHIHRVLFSSGTTEAAVRAQRNETLERLVFESGAPVREFEEALYSFLAPFDPTWSSPPEGRVETVSELDAPLLEDLRQRHYGAGPSAVATVGPLRLDEVEPVILSRSVVPEADAGAVRSAEGLEPQRNDVRNVTNAWVAVSMALPEEADRVTIDLLLHTIRERLNPETPEPGVYWADARVERTPHGPVLLVVGASFPERSAALERDILRTLDVLREGSVDPSLFRRWKRRFRTAYRVVGESPEALGARRLEELRFGGPIEGLDDRLRDLDPSDLASLVSALGAPRILRFGPDLSGLE